MAHTWISDVVGTFKVPTITGKDGTGAIWVCIDGSNNYPKAAAAALLQTGIIFTMAKNQVQYQAFYEWYPEDLTLFNGINIHPGDVITAAVAADSTTLGMVALENHTTNQTVYKDVQGNSSIALCEASAEWIVEDPESGSALLPFVNFGTVTFTDAYALGPHGKKYRPSEFDTDTYIYNIMHGKTTFTSTTTDEDYNITVQYIGGGH